MSVIDHVSLADQIAEVHREIEMRKRVYPGMIDRTKMTPHEAEVRTLNMVAVLQTLERVRDELRNDNNSNGEIHHGGAATV
jgi:hypothetical protein